MGDKTELKAFIGFLAGRVGFTFDLKNFDHRIKLQKYVYLAREFGWNHQYRYNIYVRGPYSRNLADDYYNLKEVRSVDLPLMDLDSFKEMVINKDTAWLEVATTLLSVYKNYKYHYSGKKLEFNIISRTKELKNSIPENIIFDALKELKGNGLISN